MSPSTTLEDVLHTTASQIHSRLTETVSPELDAEIDAWCDLQGLHRLDNPRKIVARQAAFNTLLKATLYEQYHQQGRLPERPADPQTAFRKIEPNELEGIRVLDPRGLDSDTVAGLAERFDSLRTAAREERAVDDAIEAIDAFLERIR